MTGDEKGTVSGDNGVHDKINPFQKKLYIK
jgi:hypothetical protein